LSSIESEIVSAEYSEKEQSRRAARPFVKWAGGKQQLLRQFESFFPERFNCYFEPFVGGGAVFFHLWNGNKIANGIFLFDNNEELINAYKTVRDDVDELIQLLDSHKLKHNRDYYYKTRALDRQDITLSDLERAARTLYLNKTCFNGLYRVNSTGQFNVPLGSYKNPKILDEELLRAGSTALQKVEIIVGDFRKIVDFAEADDFIYFDPPYDPLSRTANFTSYTAGNFGDKDQEDLAEVFSTLSDRGCLCMLSNSYTPFILNLYNQFRIETVRAIRAINSNASGRGAIKEVVVLNY
jgi:DNA adenine methylase